MNNHPEHRGNVLWINTDQIIAIYETSEVTGGSLSTKIFTVCNTLYTVEESVSEVVNLVQNGMPLVLNENTEQKKKKHTI